MTNNKGFLSTFDITFCAQEGMGINTQIDARECFDPG
jgi:hypothetical protein